MFFFSFFFFLKWLQLQQKTFNNKGDSKISKETQNPGIKTKNHDSYTDVQSCFRNNPLQNIFPFSGKNFTLLIFILPRTLFNVFSGHILRNGPNLQTWS